MFTHAAGKMAPRSFMLKRLLRQMMALRLILLVVRILGNRSGLTLALTMRKAVPAKTQIPIIWIRASTLKSIRMIAIRTPGIGTGSVAATFNMKMMLRPASGARCVPIMKTAAIRSMARITGSRIGRATRSTAVGLTNMFLMTMEQQTTRPTTGLSSMVALKPT